jgi:hypothetical protein
VAVGNIQNKTSVEKTADGEFFVYEMPVFYFAVVLVFERKLLLVIGNQFPMIHKQAVIVVLSPDEACRKYGKMA